MEVAVVEVLVVVWMKRIYRTLLYIMIIVVVVVMVMMIAFAGQGFLGKFVQSSSFVQTEMRARNC